MSLHQRKYGTIFFQNNLSTCPRAHQGRARSRIISSFQMHTPGHSRPGAAGDQRRTVMNRTLISLLAGLAGVTAVAAEALAAAPPRPMQRMVILKQDGDDVKPVFDDGNLDGRGCIIGKQAV